MADPSAKPPTVVDLVWEHDLVLAGRSGDATLRLDSAGKEGPSPVQALAFALLGCMAMDLIHIVRRARHDLRGLKAGLTGTRATEDPRRFTHIALAFTLTGNVPAEAVERAIQLSREKYCSVWSSMRQDIELTVTFTVAPPA